MILGPILVCVFVTFSEGFRTRRSLVSHGFLMFLVLMSVWLLHRFQRYFLSCLAWSRQRRRRGRRPHDVHVRCLEVHGTIHMMHMMAAKSATWSYLKRAWDNDLTFERASRSLAKTGSSGPP